MKLLLYFIVASLLVFYIGMPSDFDWSNPLQSLQQMMIPSKTKEKEQAVVGLDSTTISPPTIDTLASIDTIVSTQVGDSILLSNSLSEILTLAQQHVSSNWHAEQYDTLDADSNHIVIWNAKTGDLFADGTPYLLIHRSLPQSGDTHINIYKAQNDSFAPIMYHLQDHNTYVSDTIIDINGDNLPDFMIYWHPVSGCCPRDVSNIYLYQTDSDYFSSAYEFINPTFIPSDKSILGMTYGHPGETELYHYQWTANFHVDTIEQLAINYDDVDNNTYVSKKGTEKTVLTTIPEKYKVMESIYYGWFD